MNYEQGTLKKFPGPPSEEIINNCFTNIIAYRFLPHVLLLAY